MTANTPEAIKLSDIMSDNLIQEVQQSLDEKNATVSIAKYPDAQSPRDELNDTKIALIGNDKGDVILPANILQGETDDAKATQILVEHVAQSLGVNADDILYTPIYGKTNEQGSLSLYCEKKETDLQVVGLYYVTLEKFLWVYEIQEPTDYFLKLVKKERFEHELTQFNYWLNGECFTYTVSDDKGVTLIANNEVYGYSELEGFLYADITQIL